MARRVFAIGYFGSWLIAAALLMFVSTMLLWDGAGVSALTGVDDDATLLALPLGAALGVWAAVRTRLARAIHAACAVVGVSCALTGVWMTRSFLQRSEQLTGTGPFAGLGEVIAAGLSLGVVAVGVCMFGIWAFARLARFDDVDARHVGPRVP